MTPDFGDMAPGKPEAFRHRDARIPLPRPVPGFIGVHRLHRWLTPLLRMRIPISILLAAASFALAGCYTEGRDGWDDRDAASRRDADRPRPLGASAALRFDT